MTPVLTTAIIIKELSCSRTFFNLNSFYIRTKQNKKAYLDTPLVVDYVDLEWIKNWIDNVFQNVTFFHVYPYQLCWCKTWSESSLGIES